MPGIWPSRGSAEPNRRVSDPKRADSKRRGPASRPGASGRGRSRPATAGDREPRRGLRAQAESVGHGIAAPIRRALAATAAQRSEQRLGLTARRAAILAAVICVLTLTIAGPVRTYFAQRTEMRQLAASEKSLRAQIAELESQKAKLADPAYIAAQARERLGFVMPGDIPYQVQLPPGVAEPLRTANRPGADGATARGTDPWYSALWHTIADTPHGPPPGTPAGGTDVPVPPPPAARPGG